MSNSRNKKPGPVPGEWVELRTTITPCLDRGLAELVELTGVSKASLVRRAIADLLAATGTTHPSAPETIHATPTAGPGLAHQRKVNP